MSLRSADIGRKAVSMPFPSCQINLADMHTNRRISARSHHADRKMGNSLAVRLPATVVEVLALREGDEI